MSVYRFGGPRSSSGGSSYYTHLARSSHLTRNSHMPILPITSTNLGGALSTDIRTSRSSILPNTHGRQRTDAPATYVHDYERAIARWQSRTKTQKPSDLTCSVCLDVMDPAAWVRPTVHCTHEPKICEPCLGQYVEHAIREEGLTEVVCPDVDCRHEMDHRDVMACIQGDTEFLSRFNELAAQRTLEKHPNFVYCTNPRCGRGQIHAGGGVWPLVICRYCRTPFCYTHRVPWHRPLTCQEYDAALVEREAQQQASEEYIGEHAKRCPNPSCRRPIEKVSGCDHMTCRLPGGCGHEFCWVCLADYDPIRRQGNHLHNSSCRYYPGSSSSSSPSRVVMIGVEVYDSDTASTNSYVSTTD